MAHVHEYAKRLEWGKFSFQAADVIILITLAAFSLLGALARVTEWPVLLAENLAIGAAVVASAYFTPKVRPKFGRFLLRTGTITLSYAYLFGAVADLQLVIHGRWLDDLVLDFEQYVFGVQPTLWIEKYTTPSLTEWMMFSYVVYIPLYPILCGIIYYKHGEAPMEEYFFTLGFTNILCDIGFILFPVAGPMHWIRHLYTVPLDGYLWTTLGEFLRTHLLYAGGSIPSPHAAAATIMWVMAFRYHRPTFWVISPIIVSLFVSTFYGRYHYPTDAVAGIALAELSLRLVPFVAHEWNRLVSLRATVRVSRQREGFLSR
jgi:membrane-associated phospholipid phosphatase